MLVTVEAYIGDTATFNCLADMTPGPDTYRYINGLADMTPGPDTYRYINGLPLEGKCACDCGG